MQGLRTQESNNFIKFFEIVQEEAGKLGKTFFLDCEEGHDGNVGGMEVCDLSGWLIPAEKVSNFEKIWRDNKEDDEWGDFFVFARWKNENGVKIFFD